MRFVAEVPNDGDPFIAVVKAAKFDESGFSKVEIKDPQNGSSWLDADDVKIYSLNPQ